MTALRPKGGLTLLELLVVITLLGFVAATVTVRLTSQLGHATMSQAISQWEFTDAQLRSRARRKGQPVVLHLEIGASHVECAFDANDSEARTTRELGRGIRLAKFLSATQEVTHGPVRIDYNDHGTTATFAVELAGPHERHWLLVAGVTGQTTKMATEAEVRQLLDILVPPSVHAR